MQKPEQKKSTAEPHLECFPAVKCAYLHRVGPYENCGSAYGVLYNYLKEKGIKLNESTKFFSRLYDDPKKVPKEALRADYCIAFSPDQQLDGEKDITVKEFPAFDVYTILHKGPYDQLSAVYERLYGELNKGWLEANGRSLEGSCIEVYRNDPSTTAAADLLTDVMVVLSPPALRLVSFPRTRVLYVSLKGKPYSQLGEAWGPLCQFAAKNGIMGPDTKTLGIFYKCPQDAPVEELYAEACLTLTPEQFSGLGKLEEPVRTREIGGHDYLVYRHVGPFTDLPKTYEKLMPVVPAWCKEHNRTPNYSVDVEAGEAGGFEMYINDPSTTPPEELQVDIYTTLAPEGTPAPVPPSAPPAPAPAK